MADFSAFKGRPCPDWYARPQLGVFIHWGVFAIPAWAPRGPSITELIRTDYDNLFTLAPYAEWYENALRIEGSPTRAHHAARWGRRTYDSFALDFAREAAAFDAKAWVDLFEAAGASYVVFVAKHHDGYCLWPTAAAHPRRANWASRRDYLGELADATRARGLKFGVYYSGGLDWTFESRPITDFGSMMACVPLDEAYAAYAEAQVRELIDRYQPSVLWNDIAWPDEAQLPGLFAHYYARVPDGVVNDRWQGNRRLFAQLRTPEGLAAFNAYLKTQLAAHDGELDQPEPPHCDFRCVEYADGRNMGARKWESTRGIGLAFGYNANERSEDHLTGEGLIALYRDVTSRGGNLLINVGPMADGTIPGVQAAPLLALGAVLAEAAGGR